LGFLAAFYDKEAVIPFLSSLGHLNKKMAKPFLIKEGFAMIKSL
jgi:hypothetical protein